MLVLAFPVNLPLPSDVLVNIKMPIIVDSSHLCAGDLPIFGSARSNRQGKVCTDLLHIIVFHTFDVPSNVHAVLPI